MQKGINREMHDLKEKCEELMSYHVILIMKDGTSLDGIIYKVEDDSISVLVGEDVIDESEEDTDRNSRYKRPRRYRRFRRRRIPLGLLGAITLLKYPYAAPYPYYY